MPRLVTVLYGERSTAGSCSCGGTCASCSAPAGAHTAAPAETPDHKRHRHLAIAGRHLHVAGLVGLGVPIPAALDPDHDGDIDVGGSLDPDDDAGPGGTGAAMSGGGTAGPATASVRTAAIATQAFNLPVPVPEYPPLSWFQRPTWIHDWRATHGAAIEDDDGQVLRLTIDDATGRVGGYWYDRGVCIVDRTATMRAGSHACWSPEPSPTGYARFHQQDVVVLDDTRQAATDGGVVLLVGAVGNAGGHASETAAPSTAARHYADPNAQMMVVRLGDDERGGWLAGALVPGTTYGDVAMLRRCALSGDWRWFQPDSLNPRGGYDSLGPTLVTRPGLALVRAQRAASAEHPDFRPDDDAVVARLAAGNPLSGIAQALGAYTSANPLTALPLSSAVSSLTAAGTHAANGNAKLSQQMAARALAQMQKATVQAEKANQRLQAQHIRQYAKAVKAASKGGGKKGGGKKGGKKGGKPKAVKGPAPHGHPQGKLPKGYHMVFGRLVGPDGKVVSGGVASASEPLATVPF